MNVKHGQAIVGRCHPNYWVWTSMLQRVDCPRKQGYANYGGRGIRVCDRWRDILNFIADMGERPSKRHSIDRIDPNGDYEPGNCRWATQKEQLRNTRRNHRWTINGETLCIAEWAERTGIHKGTLRYRVLRGWTPERAISAPVQRWRGRINYQHQRKLEQEGSAPKYPLRRRRVAGVKEPAGIA